jgi:hypothetical protein
VASSSDILVEAALDRIELWIRSLEREFELAATTHRERQEIAAAEYVALLQDLLREARRGYERYRKQTAAPSAKRLRWLQQVGDTIALLESLFARLAVPISAEVTPLVAAFQRLLGSLLPDHGAVFRPVRDFNYELEEMPSDDFADVLLDRTERHKWPVLLITIPSGLLDSPRAHVLISHEIGHAIAAVHREDESRRDASIQLAKADGKPAPTPLTPLLPHPKPSRGEVLQIAKKRWEDLGFPDFQKEGGVDQKLLVQLVADVGSDIDELVDAWVEELFSDAIGASVFGPAFLMAVLDVLLTTGSLERGSQTHPPLALRLVCIGRVLDHKDLGGMVGALPPNMRARYDSAMKETTSVVSKPSTTFRTADERRDSAVLQLLLAQLDGVVKVAVEWVAAHGQLYTGANLQQDSSAHLSDLVHLGVPPLGRDVKLATVFNVGQLLCSDHLNAFCPADERHEKEPKIDALLLKAIEVNELATAWAEVK